MRLLQFHAVRGVVGNNLVKNSVIKFACGKLIRSIQNDKHCRHHCCV